jgi:hypothetical protein
MGHGWLATEIIEGLVLVPMSQARSLVLKPADGRL